MEINRYARPGPVPVDASREGTTEARARRGASRPAARLRALPVALSDRTRRGTARRAAWTRAVLAALAAQETSEAVHTFTIGFEERSFDERAEARLVAERYGTDHHELLVRPDPLLLLPALAEAFDEPFADSSALPTYLVSQLAAEHVKVALSGEGGDELFGGYYTYAADLWPTGRRRSRASRDRSSAAPELIRESQLRLQGKAFRPLRASAPARAASRLEGDLLARSARRAARIAQRLRSCRCLPRTVRGDRGRRAARAVAGRRFRHLPRR